MKKIFVFVLFFLFCLVSFAQHAEADGRGNIKTYNEKGRLIKTAHITNVYILDYNAYVVFLVRAGDILEVRSWDLKYIKSIHVPNIVHMSASPNGVIVLCATSKADVTKRKMYDNNLRLIKELR